MSAAKKLEQAPEPITTREAARRLNVSQKTVRRWIERGHLAAAELVPGCSLRVSKESVDRILANWKRKTSADTSGNG